MVEVGMTIYLSDQQRLKAFMQKVEVSQETGCWLWVGCIFQNGYGETTVTGKRQRAHRVSWELYKGPILAELQVLHTCDIKRCVNPSHLYLGTNFDNGKDAVDRKLNFKSAQTHCIHGHPLSGENLRIYRGKRVCLACQKYRNSSEYRLGMPIKEYYGR